MKFIDVFSFILTRIMLALLLHYLDVFDVSLELRLQVRHCTTKTLWS